MRTRQIKAIGVAAAALAVAACGIATSNSGGTPGGHPAPVSARHAPAADPVTNQVWLAQVKRHQTPPTWGRGVRRLPADTSSFMYQDDVAALKRYLASHAGQRARNR
jgi:hypothetical protein